MLSKKKIVAAGVITGIVVLSGCSALGDKVTEPWQDAPRSGTNNGPATVVTMPDGFNNVAGKCDGTNMVYVIYHGDSAYGAVSVVPNDPRCK